MRTLRYLSGLTNISTRSRSQDNELLRKLFRCYTMVVKKLKARSSKTEPIERGKSTSEHSLTDFKEEPKTRERIGKV